MHFVLTVPNCSSCRCAWTLRSTWSTRLGVGSWRVMEAWMTAGRRSRSSAACTPTTANWGRGASCGRTRATLAQRMFSPVSGTACSSTLWVRHWIYFWGQSRQRLTLMSAIISVSSPEEPLPLRVRWSEVKDVPQWFLQLRCGWRSRRNHIWWHQERLWDG